MRNYHLLLMLFIGLFFASCGGGGSTTKVSENSAGCIIDYYNTAVGYFRTVPSDEKHLDIIKYMKKRDRTYAGPVIIRGISERDSTSLKNPGNCFSSSTRDSIKTAYTTYLRAIEKFFDNYETYKKYRQAEDYKDDKWAKADELAKENEELLEIMQTSRSQVYSIISPLADSAEEILLEDNVLKDYILHAKTIFNSMDALMETVSEDKVDKDLVDTYYNQLEELVKKGREITPVKDMEREMDYYKKFLDEVDAYMGIVRKERRSNNYDLSLLNTRYDWVITKYNNFVN